MKELFFLSLTACCFLQREQKLLLLFRRGYYTPAKRLIVSFSKYLLSLSRGTSTFTCDSTLIRNNLEHLTKKKVHLLPIPHIRTITPRPTSETPLMLWWPGKPKLEKGWNAIRHLAQELPHPSCTLYVSEEANIPNTTPLPKHLSQEIYDEMLGKATAVLLPYDSVAYRSGTSGIFVETICAGKIPFVKKGSWLAHELEAFGLSSLILNWERHSLLEELLAKTRDPSIRNLLSIMSLRYRQFHSFSSFQTQFIDTLQ